MDHEECPTNEEHVPDQELALKRSAELSPEQPSKRSCFADKENLIPPPEDDEDKNNGTVEEEPAVSEEPDMPEAEEAMNEEQEQEQAVEEQAEREEVKEESETNVKEESVTNGDTKPAEKTEADDVVEVDAPEKPKPDMIVIDDLNDEDDDKPGPDEVPTSEEKSFWKSVEDNPNDFASWTYLLQVVEKNGKLKQIRKAFDSFLKLYPYCYGYWKKYADQLKKLVSHEEAFEVFNDAVKVIPLSVDLWTYFIHFIAEWKNGDEQEIRTIYQRAVDACGQEYKSDKIWEAYVEWEKQTDKYRVLGLYKQFLSCIIQRHQYHFDKFREWIFFTPVKDMVTMEMIKELLTKHKEEVEKRRQETERKRKEAEEEKRLEDERLRKEAEEARLKQEAEAERARIEAEAEAERARIAAEAAAERARIEAEEERARRKAEGIEETEDAEMEMESEGQDGEGEMDTATEEASAASDNDAVVVESEVTEEAMAAEEAPVAAPAAEAPAEEAPVEEEASEEFVEVSNVEEVDEVNTVTEELNKVDMDEALPDTPDALTDRQEAAIREQILLDMAPIHEQILAEIEEILAFEEGIKRPYFHVKELERAQLKNWKNYLDHVMEKKDDTRTIILFERCLIACAFYEVFWIKYATFMQKIDIEKTSEIYRRACFIHLVKKPQVHLTWAAFEETRGNVEVAREALEHIEKNLPGLISVTLRRIGLERRSGAIQNGADILKEAIEKARGRETRDFWIMKYLTYTQYILQDLQLTRTSLNEFLEKSQRNKKLYLRKLELEMHPNVTPPDLSKTVACLNSALASTLPLEDRTVFSQKKMSFLEEFSPDVASVTEAYEEHAKTYKKPEEKPRTGSRDSSGGYRRKDFSNNNNNTSRDRGDRRYNSNYNRGSDYRGDRRGTHNRGDDSATHNNTQHNTPQQHFPTNYNTAQPPAYPAMNTQNAYGMQQQQQQYQQWYSQYAAQQQQQYYSGQQRGY